MPFIFSTADTLYFDVGVLNSGNQTASSFSVDLVVEGPQAIRTTTLSWRSLRANTAQSVMDLSWENLEPGDYTAQLILDVDSEVTETGENNNVYEPGSPSSLIRCRISGPRQSKYTRLPAVVLSPRTTRCSWMSNSKTWACSLRVT